MRGGGISDLQWLEPGWSRYNPAAPLPTFMKSIPRHRPPERPAGLARCDQDCIERWTSDSFRFPPYQYKLENLLQNAAGDLRYTSASERELLLGFGFNHTHFAFSASESKGQELALEDKRLSLCGDSLSMLSFGWVISQMCIQPVCTTATDGVGPGRWASAGVYGTHSAATVLRTIPSEPLQHREIGGSTVTACESHRF